MTFGHPYFLLLLLLLPVLGWLKGKQGKPPAFVYSSVQLVRGILNVTRTRSGAFLAALRWVILSLLIIALAQPRLTKSETKISASAATVRKRNAERMVYTFSLFCGMTDSGCGSLGLLYEPKSLPLVAPYQFILFRRGGKVHRYVDAPINQM